MERDILAEVNHPFIVKLHYGKWGDSRRSWEDQGDLSRSGAAEGQQVRQESLHCVVETALTGMKPSTSQSLISFEFFSP